VELVAKPANSWDRIVDRDKGALHVAPGVVDGAMEIAQRTIQHERSMAIEAGIAVAVDQHSQKQHSSHPANLVDRAAVAESEPF
jgi:hypothetical protein